MTFPANTLLAPGAAYPLGAHGDEDGINFTLVAPHAQSVELCLFDDSGSKELVRLTMPSCKDGVWHGYLEGGALGQVYGYRVYGDYAPHLGHRFNPAKLLLDPYARAVVGQYRGQDAFQGEDQSDTAAIALKARVVQDAYEWEDDAPPQVPLADTILYEAHVKGFTQLHPAVPASLRGSYAALAQPAVLDYLQQLGITSLSLLPVHYRADEARLQKNGRSNYWGYSSLAYFAPEPRYWSGRSETTPISEFKDMVKALHSRGIEVILDVVYNHTGETDVDGPTLSFRGIDNALYYHLHQDNPAQYHNWSGCGNCLNLNQPRTLQLVMDSLRYWVQEMHVDGFRFDLAPILGRDAHGFSGNAPFFAALRQDPVLAHAKLIAEPWDIGPGGYQLGNFPSGWHEWNDKYRDTMRSFWLHQWPTLGEVAQNFAGSSDLFRRRDRTPQASVNFICAHDGFTLQDLVSYNHRHNLDNGEYNRDGQQHNHSWNCGVEGATANPQITQLRARLQRALLATLLFSQGTPMLLAGDEIGHTQQGNNNAYCQDNPLTWLNWAQADHALLAYVSRLIALRRRYPALRHVQWYTGERAGTAASGATQPDPYPDIAWLAPDGKPMQEADWSDKSSFCLGIRISDPSHDAPCLLLLNASAQGIPFVLPQGSWRLMLDSADPAGAQRNLNHETTIPERAVWLAVLQNEPLNP